MTYCPLTIKEKANGSYPNWELIWLFENGFPRQMAVHHIWELQGFPEVLVEVAAAHMLRIPSMDYILLVVLLLHQNVMTKEIIILVVILFQWKGEIMLFTISSKE